MKRFNISKVFMTLAIQKFRQINTEGNVKSQLFYEFSEDFFKGYGCWCHFEPDGEMKVGKSRGQAMDQWDEICRQVQEAYQCAVLDFESCQPWTEFGKYDYRQNSDMSPNSLLRTFFNQFFYVT